MTHLSLFTGIGGIDIAAEWAGFETVGQCEWADYPTRVLEKHWPDVPRWRDVRDVTADSFRDKTGIQRPTIISGGFPCQPHSLAGRRKASGDERDLWGEFSRVICEIGPMWVVGENVPGLLSSEDGRFFGRVLRDLAQMGYHGGWCSFPAFVEGSEFWGERTFIIAKASLIRRKKLYALNECAEKVRKGGAPEKADITLTAKRIFRLADSEHIRRLWSWPISLRGVCCNGGDLCAENQGGNYGAFRGAGTLAGGSAGDSGGRRGNGIIGVSGSRLGNRADFAWREGGRAGAQRLTRYDWWQCTNATRLMRETI